MTECEMQNGGKKNGNGTHRSPAEHPREVVSRSQGQHGDGREWFDGQFIDDGEDPAHSAVTPAGQDPYVTEITKHLEALGEGGGGGGGGGGLSELSELNELSV